MTVSEFCTLFAIGETDRTILGQRWDELTHDWQNRTPFFLDKEYFRKTYPLCRGAFPLTDLLPYVDEVVRLCRENPPLRLLAHICAKGAYSGETEFLFSCDPDPRSLLGEKYSGVYALMISLGVHPFIRRAYEKAAIPAEYADDALGWTGGTMAAYAEAHGGVPGRPMGFSWLSLYPKRQLFRIGRLEYRIEPFPEWMPAVFINRHGGAAALCGENWRLRSDGGRASQDEPSVFTTHIRETETEISGIWIRPDGVAETAKECSLSKKEWFPAVAPRSLCPTFHIPAGGRMPFEEVANSLRRAKRFFQEYLHRDVPLFCCYSWTLNPAWESLMSGSNMERLRREIYAFPTQKWGKRSGMGFLFGRADVPPEELPARNRAQRAMQEASRRNLMDTGGGFVLAGDLERLGAEYYRKNAPVLA